MGCLIVIGGISWDFTNLIEVLVGFTWWFDWWYDWGVHI